MKTIGQLLKKKSQKTIHPLDDKSVEFVFKKVVKQEYGNRGIECLRVDAIKNKKVFVKASNSNWAHELWVNRSFLTKKMNHEFGRDEISEIVV